jgi:uncharacterized protein (DUF362 family)
LKNKLTRRELLLTLLAFPLFQLKEKDAPIVGVSSAKDPFKRVYNSIKFSTGKKPEEYFSSILKKDSIVGIKLNCLAGKNLSPKVEFVEALIKILKNSGIQEENIIVFERSDKELERAGFKINKSGKGYKCYGTNGEYLPEVEEAISVGSCFSNICKKITHLINFGVLKDHDLAGISVGLKNYYGLIHNPNKYHSNNCSPYVAHLLTHPYIKDKHILTIIDGTFCQYNGGPAYNSSFIEKEDIVFSSTDLAACDFYGLERIEYNRKKNKLKTLEEEKRFPLYLQEAEKLKLTKAGISKFKVLKD